MILDLAILLACELAGEALAFWAGLPVPGPVIGLVVLVVLLLVLGRAPSSLETTASGILEHLSLLFVPAGVGVMLQVDRIAGEWPVLLTAVLLSTWITIAVTALVTSRLTTLVDRGGER